MLGLKDTVVFADQLMYTGFHYATRAGVSIGIDDMIIPDEKKRILGRRRERKCWKSRSSTQSGLVTAGERYNKVVDIWSRTNEQRGQGDDGGASAPRRSPNAKGETVEQKSMNSIYIMADSGARGSRGADPSARRHARPDGEAGRLDHRDADHGELPRRPERVCSTSSRPTALARASPTPR